MPIHLIPPERFAQVQAALREEAREAAPVVANVENAAHLALAEPLHFRGRVFMVAPISALDGLELMRLASRLEAASAAQLAPGQAWQEYRRAYREIVRTLGRLCRPRGFLARLLWALRPNPFRAANFMEVRDAMAFFARLQTRSSVGYRFKADEAQRRTTSSW